MVFGPYHDWESFGPTISYFGNLFGEGSNVFGIHSFTYANENGLDRSGHYVYLYDADEDLDTIPELSFFLEDYILELVNTDRPCDINGDGINDLILNRIYEDRDLSHITIYYGGADFDTIPDDDIVNEEFGQWFGRGGISSGFDLNGDGCDEIIAFSRGQRQFFLGGEPVDSIPVLDFGLNLFENLGYNVSGFGLLEDINNDGYDDWSLGVSNRDVDQDYPTWLFFGGDSLDLEPDRVLEFSGVMSYHAGFCRGGDLNGDGYGDILELGSSFGRTGHMTGYLGSDWVDSSYIFTINPDNTQDLHRMHSTQGAYGDFNGDGAGDFCIVAKPLHIGPRMAIYAGNPDWEVSVFQPEVYPKTYQLITESYPNPFNSTTTITYTLPKSGEVKLSIHDLHGREIAVLQNGIQTAGYNTAIWNAIDQPSGLYFCRLQSEGEFTTTKLMLLK